MSSSQERTARTFVERHGLWSDEQFEAAKRAERLIEEQGLEVVRLSFPDQHGILRGKTLMAADAARAMRNGCAMTTTLLAKDTAQKTAFPVFTAGGGFGMPEMEGGADFLMIADPATFRVLPWAPKTGWVLCDIYFGNGKPVPFSTRHLYRQTLRTLADAGYDYMAGLEVEFHIFKIDDPRLDPEAATWPPEAAEGQPAVARLCLSDRDAVRPDGAGARDGPPRGASRSGCRCARSRSSSARASANSPFIRRSASRRPTP